MKKKSALEKEVAKQLSRIKRIIKNAEKQGFTFPKYTPPKVPERVTKKTVEKLKKITPTEIYKKAKYTIPETGEVISGAKARQIKRAKRVKQPEIKTSAPKASNSLGYIPNKTPEEREKERQEKAKAKERAKEARKQLREKDREYNAKKRAEAKEIEKAWKENLRAKNKQARAEQRAFDKELDILLRERAREIRIVEQAIEKEVAKIQRQTRAEIARQTKAIEKEFDRELREQVRSITTQANKEIRKISNRKRLSQEEKYTLIASIEERKQADIEQRRQEIQAEKNSEIELMTGEIQEQVDRVIASRKQEITDAQQIYIDRANIQAEKRKAKREAKKQEQEQLKTKQVQIANDTEWLHEKRAKEQEEMQAIVDTVKLNEVNRIKALIESMKETYTSDRGYLFPKKYFEELEKRLDTLNVGELKDITEESILGEKTTKFKDPLTGTIFTGLEGRKIEDYRAELKGKYGLNYNTNANESDSVLEQIRDLIATWSPSNEWSDWFSMTKENDRNTLERILEGAIAEEGEAVVAQRCQNNAEYVFELAQHILYESGGEEQDGRRRIQFDLIAFHTVITGKSMTPEQSRELNDLMESYEVL